MPIQPSGAKGGCGAIIILTPALSGCGHLHHGMRRGIDLNTYIRDIGNYLHFEEIASPILVAHSFAGMICSAVGMQLPHILRQVICVDGIIPESNRPVVETAGDAFRVAAINNCTIWRRILVRHPGTFGGAYQDMCR
jgi:pimeloyl-ACP methyl ester carboxylesterase